MKIKNNHMSSENTIQLAKYPPELYVTVEQGLFIWVELGILGRFSLDKGHWFHENDKVRT